MIPTVDYPLVGSYNNQRILPIDSERSVNCFEYIDTKAKKPNMLLQTSGLENTQLDFGTNIGAFRALFYFNNNMYAVVGDSFYLISQSGSALVLTLLNVMLPLATSFGYIGIDANTYQIIIVDGVNGYIWDANLTTFTQITDASFPATPIDVCVLDGFFVVAIGDTNNFILSQLNQGLIWGRSSNTFTLGAASSILILSSGSTSLYPVNMQVVFSGGSLPAELVAGTTYYVVSVISNTQLQVSATLNGSPISSTLGGSGNIENNGYLQLGAITSHPGTIVACKTLHRRLFLFSQFFTEVWENQGIGTTLPFRRNNSFLMEYGTPSTGSIAVGFDKMFFLSQDRDGLGSIMEVVGVESIPVSNRALDFQLAQYAQLATSPAGRGVTDARGFLIKENGLIFYRLNFTTANHTFVYNVSMSNPASQETLRWHEEEILNGNRHPAQVHTYFNGVNYYGHYNAPILYSVDVNLTTNDGEAIRRMRIGKPVVPSGYQRTRIDRFQIDMLQGQIVSEDSITAPSLYFSYSKDGGQTYGAVTTLPMGQVGQRTFRTLQRKLGVIPRGQAFVPKIEYYSDAPYYVLGAAWAFEVLPE